LVLSRYHDTFFGQRSVPLTETLVPGLVANRFAADPGSRQILTISNSTKTTISGPLLRVPEMHNVSCVRLWGEIADLRAEPGIAALVQGSIASGEVAVVCLDNTEHEGAT
jgi:hypothetical protein